MSHQLGQFEDQEKSELTSFVHVLHLHCSRNLPSYCTSRLVTDM